MTKNTENSLQIEQPPSTKNLISKQILFEQEEEKTDILQTEQHLLSQKENSNSNTKLPVKQNNKTDNNHQQIPLKKNDYTYNYPQILKFFFLHYFKMLKQLRKIVVSKKAEKPKNLTNEDLPGLLDSDLPRINCQKFMKFLYLDDSNTNKKVKKGEKQISIQEIEEYFYEILPQKDEKYLTVGKIVRGLFYVFRLDSFLILFFGVLDILTKITSSYIFAEIISQIIEGEKTNALKLSGILGCLQFAGSTFRHLYWDYGSSMSGKLRTLLVYANYKKLSNLSTYSLKYANLGKIVNFIAADLNLVGSKLLTFFILILSPLFLILSSLLIFYRIGYYGFLGIAFLFLVFPIQNYLQQKSVVHYKQQQKLGDQLAKKINEILDGIHLIKMHSWEEGFSKIVDALRSKQIHFFIKRAFWQSSEKAVSVSSTILAAYIAFLFVNYFGEKNLDSSVLFSTVEILNTLKTNIVIHAGTGIQFVLEFKTTLKRFISILNLKNFKIQQIPYKSDQIEEILTEKAPHINKFTQKNESYMVKMEKVFGFWSTDDFTNPALKNINLELYTGKLYGITGKIESGKSSLLQLLAKEMPRYAGNYETKAKNIAFFEQQPYIYSGTIKENITFGQKFDKNLYEEVLQVCELLPDLAQMEDKDMQKIDEKGTNISGGQKARICLARALYSQADLYLLDDPLSAVDSKVAVKIFQNAIQGFLIKKWKKPVVLVSHIDQFTQQCDYIFEMNGGKMNNITPLGPKKQTDLTVYDDELRINQEEENGQKPDQKAENEPKKSKKKEKKETIEVNLKTYQRLFNYSKIPGLFILLLIFFAIPEGIFTLFYFILGKYDEYQHNTTKIQNLFIILGVLYLGYILTSIIKQMLTQQGILQSSKNIYRNMLNSLLKAPISYFEKQKPGEIMNRFTSDTNIMDSKLPKILTDCLEGPAIMVNLIITICIFNPWIIIPSLVQLIILIIWYNFCSPVIMSIRQLGLSNKSPIFSFFQSTISGISQMRIYNQLDNFTLKMDTHCENHFRSSLFYWYIGRVFASYAQYLACIGGIIGTLIIVDQAKEDEGGKVGQSLAYFLLLTEFVQIPIRQFLNIEVIVNSCERCYKIIDIEHEEYEKNQKQTKQPLQNWPKTGELQFQDVKMKYNQDQDFVLKGVNFSLKPGEKVACIGRTGAGKSSLIQSLFRLSNIEQGKIIYDGQLTSKLQLNQLRSNISIIPQNSFLFQDTIRKNIDPLQKYSDQQIKTVLKDLNLLDKINSFENGLNTEIKDPKSLFSVLDEATSNLDVETDAFIQRIIREKFKPNSVLCIAHRLNTIADYDKIVLMDNGKVQEIGTPLQLLLQNFKENEPYNLENTVINSNSYFSQMVRHTGDQVSQNILQVAIQSHNNNINKKNSI